MTPAAAAAAAISETFASAGFAPTETPILQPADPLFEIYGEEIWERAFIVDDAEDGALCLRPDHTAPIARAYVDAGADAVARLSYAGPVFRRAAAQGDPRQVLQCGAEIIGDAAAPETRDAEMFGLAADALQAAGLTEWTVRTGDVGIVFGLLEALDLPPGWRRRLIRHLWRPDRFRSLLRGFAGVSAPADADRLAFLKAFGALDAQEAAGAVARLTALTETPIIGRRGADEIAERFLGLAADAKRHPLSREIVDLIEAVLGVEGPAREAASRLRGLVGAAGAALDAELDRFDRRLDALDAAGVATDALPFDADFGRNLEYYDGFVFELTSGDVKLGGGGRYDRLFEALDAPRPVAAVGVALRPEGVAAAMEARR